MGSCPACGTALDAGTRMPCNVAEVGACVWHDGPRLRRAVLRVCADALLVYVACSKLRAYATQGFVDQCGREPDTLRPIFVVWLTLQVALLRVVRSDAYSETLMHIWQHRGSVVRYFALYGFHVVAFVLNMVAFLPWGAPRAYQITTFRVGLVPNAGAGDAGLGGVPRGLRADDVLGLDGRGFGGAAGLADDGGAAPAAAAAWLSFL